MLIYPVKSDTTTKRLVLKRRGCKPRLLTYGVISEVWSLYHLQYMKKLTRRQKELEDKYNSWKNKREENRKRYPEVAKIIDEVRKHFPGAKVTSITPTKDESK